ncbi:MAG: YraN family protein [Chloroflexi bacterium]|nr:YraN family protein [Chloroflexota bacterium]
MKPPGPSRRATGQRGERLAREFLAGQGYCIREANYRCPQGEIDLVAEKDGCLVFVEVRTRRGKGFGTPEESVGQDKAQRLLALAETYCQAHENLPAGRRIDVVAVELGPGGRVTRLEHIENAVTADMGALEVRKPWS